jgi:hypothetical protein
VATPLLPLLRRWRRIGSGRRVGGGDVHGRPRSVRPWTVPLLVGSEQGMDGGGGTNEIRSKGGGGGHACGARSITAPRSHGDAWRRCESSRGGGGRCEAWRSCEARRGGARQAAARGAWLGRGARGHGMEEAQIRDMEVSADLSPRPRRHGPSSLLALLSLSLCFAQIWQRGCASIGGRPRPDLAWRRLAATRSGEEEAGCAGSGFSDSQCPRRASLVCAANGLTGRLMNGLACGLVVFLVFFTD